MAYRTDKHGFRNPDGIWDSAQIELAFVGDSFVEGDCVGPEDNMVSVLRSVYPKTINLGMGGTGPLVHLAILKEYAHPVKPHTVLWGFYEGNDLLDLLVESQSPLLGRYLEPGFRQSLTQRQNELRRLIVEFVASRIDKVGTWKMRLVEYMTLDRVRARLLRALEAQLQLPPTYDYQLLEAILAEAKRSVASWGGTLYFVYLPDADRYFGAGDDKRSLLSMQQRTRRIVEGLGIPFIDVPVAFDTTEGPTTLWFHRNSHYNTKGYEVAGRTVLGALATPAPYVNTKKW